MKTTVRLNVPCPFCGKEGYSSKIEYADVPYPCERCGGESNGCRYCYGQIKYATVPVGVRCDECDGMFNEKGEPLEWPRINTKVGRVWALEAGKATNGRVWAREPKYRASTWKRTTQTNYAPSVD